MASSSRVETTGDLQTASDRMVRNPPRSHFGTLWHTIQAKQHKPFDQAEPGSGNPCQVWVHAAALKLPGVLMGAGVGAVCSFL